MQGAAGFVPLKKNERGTNNLPPYMVGWCRVGGEMAYLGVKRIFVFEERMIPKHKVHQGTRRKNKRKMKGHRWILAQLFLFEQEGFGNSLPYPSGNVPTGSSSGTNCCAKSPGSSLKDAKAPSNPASQWVCTKPVPRISSPAARTPSGKSTLEGR